MMKDSSFSVYKLIKSIANACNGIIIMIREERNAKIHVIATLVVICLSLYLKISSLEWVAILFSIGHVLMAEAINTSIESMADYISPKHDAKIGKIKDIAAGAVLISSTIALIIGGIILLPKILIF